MTTPRKASTKKTTAGPPAQRAPRRTAKKTAAKKTTVAPRARGRVGSNERATFDELVLLGLVDTAAGRAALEMAKWVDKADSPQGAAAAGRELRMQMAAARNVGKPLSPPAAGDEDLDVDDDGEKPAPGAVSLAAMRDRRDARRTS